MKNFVNLVVAGLFCCVFVGMTQAYTHPCIPNTLQELDTIKANLDKEPWKTGYAKLAADGHSSLNYTMQGPFVEVSRAGSYDQYLGAWRNDMIAVYNLARMWYFTGNAAYAQKGRDILIAWANTQTAFSGNESGLDLGDYAYRYGGGASILRGTWSGWTTADTNAVKNLFANVYWTPSAGWNVQGPANKGAIYMEAGIAIAVFCDDTAKFNQIVNQMRTFHGSGLMDTLAIGEVGESGRDMGHAYGMLNGLAFVSEVAYKQGVDLFSELDNRLLACGEYFSRNSFTTDNPYVPIGSIDWQWINNAPGVWTANRSAFYILQNAYKNRKGLPTPWIDLKLEEAPVDGDTFMYAKTADSTTANLSPASFPAVSLASSGLTLTTLGSQTAGRSLSYSNGVWTMTGLGNSVWQDTTDDCQFAYRQMTGDCAMVAKVNSCQYPGAEAKAGLMIRDNLTAAISQRAWVGFRNGPSPNFYMESHMRGYTENWAGTGYDDRSHIWANSLPYYVKIERLGKQITTFVSKDGASWSPVCCTYYGNLPSTVYIGLFVCSGSTSTNTAAFANVAFTGGSGGLVTTPAAPAALIATAAPTANFAVTTRWQPSFGATSYDLLRSTNPNSGYSVLAGNLTGTSYVDSSVSAGTNYYYRVRAKNSAGTSGDSMTFGGSHSLLIAPMAYLAVGGTSTASVNSGSGGEGSDQAFNRDPGSKWFNSNAASTGWIQYDFGAGNEQVVKRYTINAANDVPGRDPKDWQFQGSQDGSNWTTLNSQNNQTFAYRYQQKVYNIGNTTAYRYYRLNITANNGEAGVQLSELGLWGDSPSNLAAYYQFEGNTVDGSGNWLNATAAGGPAYTAGRIGQAVILDGVDDVITAPASVANSADITIAAWVYWNGGGNGQRIFDFGNNTSQYLFLTPQSDNNTLRFAIKNGGAEQIVETPALAAGQWVHAAVTLEGNLATLYVNGVPVSTNNAVTINPSDFNPTVNYIGDSQDASDPLFNGRIDDFRIYNYALSGTEVADLAADVPNLVAWYELEGNVNDSSGSGNNGTATGSPAYTTGYIGQAIDLDGTNDFVTLPADVAASEDITVAAWVNWDGGGNWQRIFDFGNNTSQYLFLSPSNGSVMRFAIKNGGSEQQISTTPLATGQWVHVAVTLGGDLATLYVDGVPVSTSAVTINPSDFLPTNNYIGKSQYADPLFNGRIDDLRIYDYALSVTQVAGLASNTAPPSFTVKPINNLLAIEGTAYLGDSLTIYADDPDGLNTVTFSKDNGPAWLVVAADGNLSGIPNDPDVGENIFTVRVTDDGGLSDTAQMHIQVLNTYSGTQGLNDLAGLASQWLMQNCSDVPACGGADLDGDASVTLSDFAILANNWMIE